MKFGGIHKKFQPYFIWRVFTQSARPLFHVWHGYFAFRACQMLITTFSCFASIPDVEGRQMKYGLCYYLFVVRSNGFPEHLAPLFRVCRSLRVGCGVWLRSGPTALRSAKRHNPPSVPAKHEIAVPNALPTHFRSAKQVITCHKLQLRIWAKSLDIKQYFLSPAAH